MSLSDKIYMTDASTAEKLHYANVVLVEDVKEFIRNLKEEIDMMDLIDTLHTRLSLLLKHELKEKIDELAGDELVEVRV